MARNGKNMSILGRKSNVIKDVGKEAQGTFQVWLCVTFSMHVEGRGR